MSQANQAVVELKSKPLNLFNVTLDWEPGDNEQGDYATSVWAVDHDDAIRRVAEEMADSGEVQHDSSTERAEYIERVIRGAGQYAASLVEDTLSNDLENLLKDRPGVLARVKAILNEQEQPAVIQIPESVGVFDHMVVVPATALSLLIGMSKTHVDDIESGIRDGDYVASDNETLPEKQAAVATLEQLYQLAVKGQRMPVNVNPYATLTEICESLDGLGKPIAAETVDGDNVDWVSRALYFAEVALGRRREFPHAIEPDLQGLAKRQNTDAQAMANAFLLIANSGRTLTRAELSALVPQAAMEAAAKHDADNPERKTGTSIHETALAAALKDICNAADNGQAYSPAELKESQAFGDARTAAQQHFASVNT
jgi:hypothetical protein